MSLSQVFQRIEKTSLLYFITIIIAAVFFVYLNTLGNGLFYDDEDFIYKNQYVAEFNIPKFFSENLIAGSGKISNYYRPVLAITFAIEHAIFGYSGFIYHFNSVLIHSAASVLLFLLLYKLFGNKTLALLSSLLFSLHPIQTEAVSYASGRGDPLSLFFLLLTILLSLSTKTQYKILSFVTIILALLSKELALITPLLLFLTHLVNSKKLSKEMLIQSFKVTFPYLLIAVGYFTLRLSVLNFQNTLNFYNGTNIYTENVLIRINTFINLIPQYLSLLVYPKTLFIERPATVYASITLTTLLVPLISLIIFGIGIKYFKKNPIILFSVVWFYLSFIPTSGIIPINGIFYEHFVYIPSIGFFTLISAITLLLFQKTVDAIKVVILLIVVCIFLLLSTRTIARNTDWHDPITFYTQTLQHTKSSRLLNNLAMAYAENGQYEKSIEVYKQAIKEGDIYPQTHYNLANSYITIGKISDGEIEYKKALELDPTFYLSYIKLFQLYKNTNNTDGQEWVIKQVEQLTKHNKNFEPLLQELQRAQI